MEKPFKVDDELLEYDYLESHLQEFEKVYELLEDEQSKTIFLENINLKQKNILQFSILNQPL